MTHNEETLKAAEEHAAYAREINENRATTYLAGCEYRQQDIDELVEFIDQRCIPYLPGRLAGVAQQLIQKHKK